MNKLDFTIATHEDICNSINEIIGVLNLIIKDKVKNHTLECAKNGIKEAREADNKLKLEGFDI